MQRVNTLFGGTSSVVRVQLQLSGQLGKPSTQLHCSTSGAQNVCLLLYILHVILACGKMGRQGTILHNLGLCRGLFFGAIWRGWGAVWGLLWAVWVGSAKIFAYTG